MIRKCKPTMPIVALTTARSSLGRMRGITTMKLANSKTNRGGIEIPGVSPSAAQRVSFGPFSDGELAPRERLTRVIFPKPCRSSPQSAASWRAGGCAGNRHRDVRRRYLGGSYLLEGIEKRFVPGHLVVVENRRDRGMTHPGWAHRKFADRGYCVPHGRLDWQPFARRPRLHKHRHLGLLRRSQALLQLFVRFFHAFFFSPWKLVCSG